MEAVLSSIWSYLYGKVRARAEEEAHNSLDQQIDKTVSNLKDVASNVLDLDGKIEHLRNVLPKIKASILNVEAKPDTVELYRGVKDFVEDAEDIVDEYRTELAQRSPSPIADRQRNMIVRWVMGVERLKIGVLKKWKIAKQLKGLHDELAKLKRDHDEARRLVEIVMQDLSVVREENTEVDGLNPRLITDEVPRADVELVGREWEKGEVIRLLLDTSSGPSVVLVRGLPGIGKTTLVKGIFDAAPFVGHFHIKKWMEVGSGLSSDAILQILFGSGNRAEALRKLKGTRFLIVLDDCRNGEIRGWDELWVALSHGDVGSKVLITSRQDISSKLGGVPVESFELHRLSDEVCQQIFDAHAFPYGVPSSSSILREIGREIVNKKIQGVPLGARVLGSSLRNEPREDVWNQARVQISHEITSVLMWSYRRLPSHLKLCFAHWSFLPKNYTLPKKHLVWMWIAHGYVQTKINQKLEYIAENYVDYLVRASLIQCVPDYRGKPRYTMLNLIHELAINVSRTGYYIPNNEVGKENQSFPEKHLDNKRLRVLVECGLEDRRISEIQLQYLRILASNHVQSITTINFGNMIHLRFLDLSEVEFDPLPESICSIYNLQTLILNDKVKNFPSSTWKLPNLRHLEGGTDIRMDGICRSTSLQTVSNFNLFKEKDIEELENLKELCELKITHLNHVRSRQSVLKARLDKKEFIHKLVLQWKVCSENEVSASTKDVAQNELLENMRPHDNLRILKIKDYMGDRFPSWMGGIHPLKLVRLTLSHLPHLKKLPPLGRLPHLEYLRIKYLNNLRNIDGEFYGTEHGAFRSLKELHLEYMDALKDWKGYSSRRVRITDGFPALEFLTVDSCKKLRSLPYLPRHLKRLYLRITGLRVLPEMQNSNNDSSSRYLHSLQVLTIEYCPVLNPDEWFRKYKMPSLVRLSLIDIDNCFDLVINYSRQCLEFLDIKYMSGLRSITMYNLVPSEVFTESDHKKHCAFELESLRLLNAMTVVNCEDGKITAGRLELTARTCSPIWLLQENGSRFEPHRQTSFLYGDFLYKGINPSLRGKLLWKSIQPQRKEIIGRADEKKRSRGHFP